MAIDYFLELNELGTEEKKSHFKNEIKRNFSLEENEISGILSGQGLSISIFISDDCDVEKQRLPSLVILFRLEKNAEGRNGHVILRKIIDSVSSQTITDFRVTDELENRIFIERSAGITRRSHPEDDFWA